MKHNLHRTIQYIKSYMYTFLSVDSTSFIKIKYDLNQKIKDSHCKE